MRKKSSLFITQAGLIAAAYVALTALSSAFGLGFDSVQFRLSEALTILPVFTPAAIPGLAIGCAISNLASPFGIIDIVLGTFASFLAAIVTRKLGKYCIKGLPLYAILPPILFNALIVGAELTFILGPRSFGAFSAFAFSVGAGQAAVCFFLGLPLAAALRKSALFKGAEVLCNKP